MKLTHFILTILVITACTAQKLKNTKILKNASQNTKEQSLWTQLMKSYQKHLNILDNRVANQNTSNKDHSAVSIRICKHSNPMENTLDCIEQVVKSSMPSAKFVVATQSIELRSKLRFFGPENGSIPVPLIYVNRSVMIMEPPSTAVYQTAESIERDKQAIDLPKTENNPNELVKKPKKFRKKQPNPLSCKKPKKRDPPPQKTSSRKRYRKKSSNETTSIE